MTVLSFLSIHLWKKDGVLHACQGDRLVDDQPNTYVVWTLCGQHAQQREAFFAHKVPTCEKCAAIINSTAFARRPLPQRFKRWNGGPPATGPTSNNRRHRQ